jgi:hypothetical protein
MLCPKRIPFDDLRDGYDEKFAKQLGFVGISHFCETQKKFSCPMTWNSLMSPWPLYLIKTDPSPEKGG